MFAPCALVLALCVLTACETSAPYREAGPGLAGFNSGQSYGYNVKDLGDGEYAILVRASQATPPERLEDIARLRAAHLTLDKGATHFTIIHTSSLTIPTRTDVTIPITIRGAILQAPFASFVDQDKLAVVVVSIRGAAASAVAGSIDARAVVNRLAPVLER
jgi:hypothetical protein